MAREETETVKRMEENLERCWHVIKYVDDVRMLIICISLAWHLAVPEMNDQMRLELSAKLWAAFSSLLPPDDVERALKAAQP